MTPKMVQGPPEPKRAATGSGGPHPYTPSANPRTTGCVRCGKPASAHLSSELQRATAIAHFERAVQRIREGDTPSARLEAEAALRILEER
jgi:hypothetical protein